MSFSLFSSSSVRRKKNAGFTLLEVVITMIIFVLLCAAVFGLMSGVLQSASSLQDNQNHRDQLERLNAFLEKKLKGLPAQSAVISYQRGQGEGLTQSGIILGHDVNLIAIDAKIQANGYYTLRLATFDPATMPKNIAVSPTLLFETNVIQDTTISWTPLIRDITQLSWKFQNINATEWLDLWSDPSNPPNIVEFSIHQAGDLQTSTMDFWLPRMVAIRSIVATQTGARTPSEGGAATP
jgi:prepilin-type N-terminal cleavage/methylation domain-containing protein